MSKKTKFKLAMAVILFLGLLLIILGVYLKVLAADENGNFVTTSYIEHMIYAPKLQMEVFINQLGNVLIGIGAVMYAICLYIIRIYNSGEFYKGLTE